MNAAVSHAGYVKRIDALLRARFPNLVTRIFEVRHNTFEIVFDRDLQDASDIANEFDYTIRFVTVGVTLSNTPPYTYLNEIQPFTDAEASGYMAGLPLTRIDVLNFLVSRFPKAGILDVQDDQPGKSINIILPELPDDLTKEAIADFFDSLEMPVTARLTTDPKPQQINVDDESKDPLYVWAAKLRSRAPAYVANDEAFWFENIRKISSKQFPLERFPDMKKDVFRCYLDLSLGNDHINLRQALLLYDEVWCSPPLADRQNIFLKRQALEEADLFAMVDAGRLRFVTTQPEERLDISFLEKVHDHNPTAILGRRTTAALLVADVAQTAETSFLNDPSLYSGLRQAAEILANETSIECSKALRTFLWPFVSRRGALQGLLARGSKSGPILALAEPIAAAIKAKSGVNVEIESVTLSEAVHIGHSLNATVFGPLDEPTSYRHLKAIIAHQLNFHRSFNAKLAASWIENELRRADGVELTPPVQLFEFKRSVPIRDILSNTSLSSTRTKGRGLYARLANLSLDERQGEIEKLEKALQQDTRQKAKLSVVLNVIDAVGFIGSIFGMFLPPIGSLFSGRKQITEKLRRVPQIDSMMEKLEDNISQSKDSQELDFLSRVSRIATFKENRV